MKSILIGLTVILWIQFYPGYTQTGVSENDSLYCLPISTARNLVADALRLRLADSIIYNNESSIALLERQMESSHQSFSNLLKIEQDKYKTALEKSLELQKINTSFQQQLSGVQKNERRHKREKVALGGALVVVIILALVK